MPRGHNQFGNRGRSSRRETLWLRIAETQTTLAGASTAALFTGFTSTLLAARPFTIIRTRGWFSMRSDQISSDETYGVGLGMAVVSDQAAAIGITAVPTPSTDGDSDLFFLYEEMYSRFEFFDATGVNPQNSIGRTFDSKASRKVEEGQDLAITVETGTISLGAVVIKAGRMLIKLH